MARRRAGVSSGLRWLAIMSTAVLLAVIVTQPGRPPDKARRFLVEDSSSGSSSARTGGADAGAAGAGAEAAVGAGAAAGRTTAAAGETSVVAAGGGASSSTLQARAAREACIVAATTDPTPVHGRVQKKGALPMHLLDGPNTTQRHRAYFNWRDTGSEEQHTQEALVEGVLTRVGRPPPLFPYCRILVNHAYRTLYLKAPKTGSTSLLTLLGTCTGNATTDKATCFRPLKVMRSEQRYEEMYASYFVFTVTRNPWARAVSSYRMLSRYMKHGCKDVVGGWNKVCMDVNHMPLVHNHHPLCTINKQQGEGFALHHFIPQAPCLVTAAGEWAADHVVRIENLQEDMREVLMEMNARRQPEAPELDVEALLSKLTNVNKVHVACRGIVKPTTTTAAEAAGSGVTLSKEIAAVSRRKALANRVMHLEAPESYCNTEQYYMNEHTPCFDGIAAYYKEDVKLFGLPTCQ